MRTLPQSEQFIQAFSGIFRDIQQYSAMLRHIQTILRHIVPYSDIFRTLFKPCLYNLIILRSLAYLEPDASWKACLTSKMIMHIQNPCIVRTVYSSIFKDIYGYSKILMHIQPHSGIFLFGKHPILIAWQCSEYT